jgi:hypothetical protein
MEGMDGKPGKDTDGARNVDEAAATHHRLHRHGAYLDIDGEVDVDYGDGSPEWLADRLRGPEPDPWAPRRSDWEVSPGPWEGERQ